MTRAEKDRLLELIEAIYHRHSDHKKGDRTLREVETWHNAGEALLLLRKDSA